MSYAAAAAASANGSPARTPRYAPSGGGYGGYGPAKGDLGMGPPVTPLMAPGGGYGPGGMLGHGGRGGVDPQLLPPYHPAAGGQWWGAQTRGGIPWHKPRMAKH